MTPPPPVDTDVSKEKKGKKGKGKKGHSIYFSIFRSALATVFGKKVRNWKNVFHSNWSQMQAVVYGTPSLLQLPIHFAATALFLLSCKKLWKI